MIHGTCHNAVLIVQHSTRWQERSLKLHALLRGESESCGGAQRVFGREAKQAMQRFGAYAASGFVARCCQDDACVVIKAPGND